MNGRVKSWAVETSKEIEFKSTDVSFSCVCTVIDDEFRHNIFKVAVDTQGDSRVDPQTTLTMLGRNSLSITGQTHEIVRSRSLPHRIN